VLLQFGKSQATDFSSSGERSEKLGSPARIRHACNELHARQFVSTRLMEVTLFVVEPRVSFNLLLHHTSESKAILEARAERCFGVHLQTNAHDKCWRG